MTKPQIIRNVYCTHPDDRVIAHTCACCRRCWLFVAGPKRGQCAFGGPFAGYDRTDLCNSTPN